MRNLGGAAATVEGPTGQAGASPEAYEPLRGALGPVVLEGRAAGAPRRGRARPWSRGDHRCQRRRRDVGARHRRRGRLPGGGPGGAGRATTSSTRASPSRPRASAASASWRTTRPACEPGASSVVVDVAEGTPIDAGPASLETLTSPSGGAEIEPVGRRRSCATSPTSAPCRWCSRCCSRALGVAGLAHGLLVALRRRRRDIGVARALGFTTGQAAATLAWQAAVVASGREPGRACSAVSSPAVSCGGCWPAASTPSSR